MTFIKAKVKDFGCCEGAEGNLMENTVVATFLYIAGVTVAASGVIIIALRKYMDRVVSYVYGGEHFP